MPSSPEQRMPLFEVAPAAGVPDELLRQARASAHATGYAAGWASGVRAAADRARAEALRVRTANDHALEAQRERAAQCFTGLDAAAAALEQRALPTLAELESLIIGSALAIAEALVGDALRSCEGSGCGQDGSQHRAPAALARVLHLVPSDEPVTVRLSPADHALLTATDTLPLGAGRQITLVADPALSDGDAIATSGATEIDGRIRAGFARVREALGA